MHDSSKFKGSFLIADLTGYTALTEAHGDFSAAQIVNRYYEIVKGLLTKDVHFYQQVGDEIFMISNSVSSLLHYAINLRDEIEKESHFPSIHAGLHHGSVIKQDEKIFGSVINLTSRIAGAAHGGQILCSESFKDSVKETKTDFHFLGEKRFKNVLKPVAIYEIEPNIESDEIWYNDLVCRMHFTENNAPAKLPFHNKTIYFCSFECAKNFISHPELYIDSSHE
jgi:class 3 adenylate cyclase/YHS domain-containing protein